MEKKLGFILKVIILVTYQPSL